LIVFAPPCTPDVEFSLAHPHDATQTARVGFDLRRGGHYVEIAWNDTLVTFDQADLDDDDAITGVIRLLASWGFLDPVALDDLRAYLDTPSCWRSTRAPRAVRRVLAIVEALEVTS
jgi:hypothetical protein